MKPMTSKHEPHSAGLIPPGLKEEHHELHGKLRKAMAAPGQVGEDAKAVNKALEPHFRREEEIALPPLGLLLPIIQGKPIEDKERILAMTDSLTVEYPRMLAEHETIRAAVERLRHSAEKAGNREVAQFAEGLAHHARLEEEVMYPSAILVGLYLKTLK